MSKISTDPNRIVSIQQLLGTINCILGFGDAITPSAYIEWFNTEVDKLLEWRADLSPSNVKLYISHDDGDITYEIYADTIESVADYEYRMKQLKEAEEAEEARKVRLARSELIWDAENKRRLEKKEREAQEFLALSTDPELEDYTRLKDKFKLYDAVKKDR